MVEVKVEQPCVRCTLVARAQPGIDRDVDVYRTLLARHDGTFGVLAAVTVEGILREGDSVEVI